eukprot:2207507-Rhodomonas_salina.1
MREAEGVAEAEGVGEAEGVAEAEEAQGHAHTPRQPLSLRSLTPCAPTLIPSSSASRAGESQTPSQSRGDRWSQS